MKFLYTLLLMCATASAFVYDTPLDLNLQRSGNGPLYTFADTNSLVAGVQNEDGTFTAQPVNPQVFFGGIVFEVDSNSLAVINGKLYVKSINSGDFVGLATNLSAVVTPGFFTNSSRLILGSVPSFDFSSADGISSGGGMDVTATQPEVQWSADNGTTWKTADNSTNIPVLVSVYCNTTYSGAAISNVTVYSYVNQAIRGSTNDFTGQVILVDMTSDDRSVVNVAGAHSIGATEAAKWANYAATAQVNANGHGIALNNTWSVTTPGNNVTISAGGVPSLTFYPSTAQVGGTNAHIDSVALTNGVLTFAVSSLASNAPVIVWATDISATSWTVLTQTTNWTSGGEWYVKAAVPNQTQAFFKASASVTLGPAVMQLANGGTRYDQFSTAPTAAFIGGDATHTNHLLLNVNGAFVDYWCNGTTVWSKQLAP